MLVLSIVSLLAGVLLGTRFKFFVLVPAIMFVSLAVSAAGVAHTESIGSIALGVGIASAALQAGYLIGLFSRRILLMIRAALQRGTAPSAAAVTRPAN